MPELPVNRYVTLVSNEDYVLGAKALARSLHMCHSQSPLTVLAAHPFDSLAELETLGCEVLHVEPLPLSEDFRRRHSRDQQHSAAPFTKGNKPQFHNPLDNFLKLRLWELDQYEKII